MIVNSNGLSKILNNKTKRTQTNLQKTIDKLSSGQRIRSAANDASGLAISQKMLELSRGSHQAIRNVQDAGSLVQVADGAMQEMTQVVQRIRELTIQAMNGTNTEVTGQSATATTADTIVIQNEIDQLKKDLNDIVYRTEFNNKKILTNKTPSEYIYENRTASKIIQLSPTSQTHAVDIEMNSVGYEKISPVIQTSSRNDTYSPTILATSTSPVVFISSTVMDYQPRWSSDGDSIIFSSSRNGGQYVVPADGSIAPVENINTPVVIQKMVSDNGLMRLRNVGTDLYLESRPSTASSWNVMQSFSYNQNDGNLGYSFSPKVDAIGNTSFIFSDNFGNIKKVGVNIFNRTVTSGPIEVIPTSDTLNIPPVTNTLNLPQSPDLYKMNTADASLRIEKVNDNGSRLLTYWDGVSSVPAGGYYTVSGGNVTFYGDSIIGNESVDDAQDYYRFSYVSDSFQDDIYTTSIPSGAEVYNMHGESGPRSLNIRVGSTVVSQSQLLASRPIDVNSTTGVYVDETTGKIEFYGNLRPSYNESVTIEYINDIDGRNSVQTFSLSTTAIDTYNLENADLTANRSMRVYVGGTEIRYDSTKTNGYTYENGKISLYGNARPDITSNSAIKVDFVYDSTGTTKDVYGIPLSYSPQVYNLGSAALPNSIRVFRNSTEEIAYSNTDGFQYNTTTNTIELYGAGRPNVGDTYTIRMIAPTGDLSREDDKVEIPLTYSPETYGVSGPSTFRVIVDGNEVSYDSTKTNGFFYNSSTQRIELYGDARPEAKNVSNPDVEVYYAFESPAVSVGNDSYDFRLASNTLDYGVVNQTSPKAIRIYQNGMEVPYDEDNGFTYDQSVNKLSLHGSYRPDKNDSTGSFIVYSITGDDLKKTVPQGSYVYKVMMNGQEVQKAQNSSGDGFIYNGQQVEIVGNARPDVTNTMSGIILEVQYFSSLDISLNESMPTHYFHHYCDHESSEGLIDAEVDPKSLAVSLNGSLLSSNQYSLQGGKVLLNGDTLALNNGSHTISVDYRVRQGIGYEANKFTFHTGANSSQNFKVEIASFDNMLRDTNIICVRNREDAEKGLEVIDRSLAFILNELGEVGAVENALDHMASNLASMEENTIASMSRIQDADMAKEAMNLVKEQILSQTQEAMAVHLKRSREQVLELLK
ncbi:flagellin [Metabacillus fastidiosus]|uniref:flagellin N-terminal helical domain-containing protein n=1 Tax=Metabacillus fastidiosus TaxID=1458 RepID=UPI002E1EC6EC|nr:flagellin [Metabacillus fastidiosus]MED4454433.1 flagellin [Metabacillus fastidiosus]